MQMRIYVIYYMSPFLFDLGTFFLLDNNRDSCYDKNITNCRILINVPDNEPEYDRDEVISRLLAEQRQTSKLLNEIRRAIDSDAEFQGLSHVGGVKAILRRYQEEKEKVFNLEKELTTLIRKKK